jgi:hypothetical protein
MTCRVSGSQNLSNKTAIALQLLDSRFAPSRVEYRLFGVDEKSGTDPEKPASVPSSLPLTAAAFLTKFFGKT